MPVARLKKVKEQQLKTNSKQAKFNSRLNYSLSTAERER